MKPELSVCGSSGKIYVGFLVCQISGTSDQMKVFNSVNFWVSETSDKLHGLLFSTETLVYLLSIKIFPSASIKDPLPCIKHTECDMDSKSKLKVFKEIVDKFRTKSMAWRLFIEKYFLKKISQFFI